jgi:hypothetical protein
MRIRLSLVSAALLLGALPVALYAPAACAGEAPHAALVVDTGDSELSLCVELPDASVTGIELIRLAGEQHGLEYTFGYGGEAVCQLAGVGPEGDDCFADYPDFWGYWRGSESGGWTWSPTGAGTTSVEAGDVEGWSWGSGQDGSSHQQPPLTTFEAVCGAPSVDGEDPEPGETSMTDEDTDDDGGGAPTGGDAPGSEEPVIQGDEPADAPDRAGSELPDASEPGTRDGSSGDAGSDPSLAEEPTTEPQPHVALVARSDDPEEPGPPVVGLVGLGLAIGLGITAAAMTAARRKNTD